jgi:hypothetical protein
MDALKMAIREEKRLRPIIAHGRIDDPRGGICIGVWPAKNPFTKLLNTSIQPPQHRCMEWGD